MRRPWCIQSVNLTRYLLVIHFQVIMTGKREKTIFREMQTTNKLPLNFLDVKELPER